MIDILNFNPNALLLFFLILLRVSGIFVTAPVVSSRTVPRRVRAYAAILCTLIVFNIVPKVDLLVDFDVLQYFLIALKETMVGLMLGVVPRVMFAAVELAGAIIGFQMGFSIANVVDPQTDVQVSVIGSFETVLATLLFVILDGHHVFFEAMATSYTHIPIKGFLFTANKIDFLLRLMGDLFIIAVKIGAPFIVALLMANIIMGFMARSIPQMNVFVVGFPFTIGVGLLLLLIGTPYMVQAMVELFNTVETRVIELIQIMAK